MATNDEIELKKITSALLKMSGSASKATTGVKLLDRFLDQFSSRGAQSSALLAVQRSREQAASVTLGGALAASSRQMAMVGTQSMNIRRAFLTNFFQPGEQSMTMLAKLAPKWAENTARTGEVASGLNKIKLAASGVGLGLGVLGLVMQAIGGATRGVAATFRALTGSLGIGQVSLSASASYYAKARGEAALFGASQEDVLRGTKALQEQFLLSGYSMRRFGSVWFDSTAASVSKFMGLAKASGFASEQSAELAGNLTMMGVDARRLPDALLKMHQTIDGTIFTLPSLAEAIATLAPASMTSANATKGLFGIMRMWGNVIDETRQPILAAAKESGRFRLMADAFLGFVRTAAQLSIPEMLAFGGGGTSNLEGMMRNALAPGQSRANVLLSYVGKVMESTRDPSQRTATATMLFAQKGLSFEQARVAGEKMVELQALKMSQDQNTTEGQRRISMKQLEVSAFTQAAIQDPMERLVAIAESILVTLAGMAGIFKGVSAVGSIIAGSSKASPSLVPTSQ